MTTIRERGLNNSGHPSKRGRPPPSLSPFLSRKWDGVLGGERKKEVRTIRANSDRVNPGHSSGEMVSRLLRGRKTDTLNAVLRRSISG